MKGEYLNKMKNMGEFFDLPIEIISHKALITALVKNEGNIDHAINDICNF